MAGDWRCLSFFRASRNAASRISLSLLITTASCYFTYLWKPDLRPNHILTIGLGYLSLLYIVVTLVIGPWQLLSQRRNPVNINLRRDIGIWAGITGILHVYYGFQVHLRGDIVLYFFQRVGRRGTLQPLRDLFGISNYLGAAATVVLVLLFLLSNQLSLRWLKGRLWKFLQRFNYILFLLVVAHTLGYQIVVERESVLTILVVGLFVITVAIQLIGIFLYVFKSRRESLVLV